MDSITPLSGEDRRDLLLAIYRDVHRRRPDLLRGNQSWRPGGVHDLPDLLSGILAAARLPPPNCPDDDFHRWTTLVCRGCDHQTPCGYCVHGSSGVCVLREEAVEIIAFVRNRLAESAAHR